MEGHSKRIRFKPGSGKFVHPTFPTSREASPSKRLLQDSRQCGPGLRRDRLRPKRFRWPRMSSDSTFQFGIGYFVDPPHPRSSRGQALNPLPRRRPLQKSGHCAKGITPDNQERLTGLDFGSRSWNLRLSPPQILRQAQDDVFLQRSLGGERAHILRACVGFAKDLLSER